MGAMMIMAVVVVAMSMMMVMMPVFVVMTGVVTMGMAVMAAMFMITCLHCSRGKGKHHSGNHNRVNRFHGINSGLGLGNTP